jgi:hypothetical protein
MTKNTEKSNEEVVQGWWEYFANEAVYFTPEELDVINNFWELG